LPPGWTEADLGGPAQPGSTDYTNGTWTVSGGGSGICPSDQFHLVSTTLAGDGGIVTRVAGVQSADFFAQGGLIFRGNSTTGAVQVALLTTPSNGLSFQWRTAAGAGCNSYGLGGVVTPVWLKLQRTGNTFWSYYSLDGTNWAAVGTPQQVDMNATAVAGLAVCANNNNAAATACTFTDVSFIPPVFGLQFQRWDGLQPGATTLAALTNSALNPRWPNSPDTNFVVTALEIPTNSGAVNYGARIRGFLVPPVTAEYRFGIASDNSSELSLSPDEWPSNKLVIASVATATGPREWNRETNQQSAPIPLTAGMRYYFETLMQQGDSTDHLAVRWQFPDGGFEDPVAASSTRGTQLVPFKDADDPPGIYTHPASQTVWEGSNVVFSVLVTNQAAVSYSWRSNGLILGGSGAAQPVLVVSNVNSAQHNGLNVSCVVSNSRGVTTSAVAYLSVLVDTVPPSVLRTRYLGPTQFRLEFSEAVAVNGATNTSNYVIDQGIGVLSALLDTNGAAVTLTTTPLSFGSNYTLVINGLQDRAYTPNLIATNTTVKFYALPYSFENIGGATPAGSVQAVSGGYNLAGGGADIGGTFDQMQYFYEHRSGDFDIAARLESLSAIDLYTKAGLIAREATASPARFAAVLATPSLAGVFFESRSTYSVRASVGPSVSCSFPVWLRLRRVGDLFTGYASYDGKVWQALGSISLVMANPICVGMAVSSHDQTRLAQANFRDISEVTNAVTGTLPAPPEPPGPSSRRTGLVLSEIMYHPAARTDGRRMEFIEVLNPQPFFEDISGYSISGDVDYTFPEGTVLKAGAFAVIAANPADLEAVYGLTGVLGPFTNNLSNSSGTVRLRNRIRGVLLEVKYESKSPWPVAADGSGHSLVLARPSYGESDPRAWSASRMKGGSPGRIDPWTADAPDAVLINEFLAHTDLPQLDSIELFNTGLQTINLGGCYLTDDPATNKFRIPDLTIIVGRGFAAFTENDLGFRLDAGGEALYLVNSNDTRVIDAVRFAGQANGVASGRCPDGSPVFRELATPTLGTNNAPALRREIVINEIMYEPVSGDAGDQYIELYNRGSQAVELSGWRFTDGVSYTFPANTILGAGSYLVVAKDFARLLTNYPNLNASNLLGDFGGSLSGSGERLTLSMPDEVVSTNSQGVLRTNVIWIKVNEVTWGTGGRWGKWSNGGGSSLELIDPDADNTLAPNWADSDETAKAAWTNVELTGVLDLGSSSYSADQLQIFLAGPGECLVDEVEVFTSGGTNRISNPSFNSGATGWTFVGTHRRSGVDASGGYGGGSCLHLRASGRGDTSVNRVRATFSSVLASGSTATLRAKARWLKGNPDLLLRLHGNWLEAPGTLAIPSNLGTPGIRNSRAVNNAGPAITEVAHYPILPAASQPVTVTARVHDPDGLASVQLIYRNDNTVLGPVTVTMRDDGAGADAFAGDGVYSAMIPGVNGGTLIAFYVRATDAAATPATTTFPSDAAARECLVRFGEPVLPGIFGNYHMWLIQTNVTYWSNREKNSNEPVDATFVYGNFRVVYNMETLYSGSPFHTPSYNSPVGNACDYVLHFPNDDRMLGADDFVIATLGNLGSDDTAQREQAAFWLMSQMGVPSLHRRYVGMFVNGTRRGTVLEDAQQPSSDHVSEYFPDDDAGQLHKIEDWFEFDDAGNGRVNVDATLAKFTTTGGAKKTARYRWCWRPRAVRDNTHDFTNLFTLVDALGSTRPEPYTSAVGSLMDMEEWARVFAVERLVGNWDSYSYQRGKNMYAYKPERSGWALLPWDIDFVLGLGDAATTSLFGGHDGVMNTLYAHPPFARAYWRAFYDAANGPLLDARINPVLDAKYNALLANGITPGSPSSIKSYVGSRRNFLVSQLATVAANFTLSTTTVSNNSAILSGTAPVAVKTITFNGGEYPATWTTLTNWTATIPLVFGSNWITVLGLDTKGKLVTGASNSVAAISAVPDTSPVGKVVINEILYNPAIPQTEYVELYNASSNVAFDVSGWRFNGLSYTFPDGSAIAPNRFLLLAANRGQFANVYGPAISVFDQFDGSLQTDGETLSLIRPGVDPSQDLVVTKVRYRNTLPWPPTGNPPGASLQLLDPLRDNWRVGNWGVGTTNSAPQAQWVYATATGSATSSRVYIYLLSAGDIYVDDLKLVLGTVPEVGANVLTNGDFEKPLAGTWTLTPNFSQSVLSTAVKHQGNSSLHVIATAAGSGNNNAVYQNISPALTIGQTYTLSFWYLQSTNGGPLVLRLSGNGGLNSGEINPAPPPPETSLGATPGKTNSLYRARAAFPPLWINEVQVNNATGITNRIGQRVPWLELFNPTAGTIFLTNLYLANQYTNLTQWAFPSGASIGPAQFKVVFADGRTDLNTASEWHTSFSLASNSPALALTRMSTNSQLEVLDYLDIVQTPADRSFGSWPDAQAFDRQEFYFSTPGKTNNNAGPAIQVFINEWMAENTYTLRDPADDDFEDWFELYNAGPTPADLSGFYLTDTATNQFQFQIPPNHQYVIPPKGYLLVWADNETKQNATNRADLHTNFKLDKDGDFIGLYAPDGSLVDAVTFGSQVTDLSQGRYPDGQAEIRFLPMATPLTNNPAPNSPPVLEPLPDRNLILGHTLSLVVTATDPDLPRQGLTFSLGPGSPAAATIDPRSGILLWAPSSAPSTNLVTVMVTDDGAPNLSATTTFAVWVLQPPQIQGISAEAGEFSFSWYGAAGVRYQVEFKDNLEAPLWSALGTVVTGNNQPFTITETLAEQRFYRVRVLP
jgi:regulation of enolase protein 1 (concanavalin A-like superfamily)